MTGRILWVLLLGVGFGACDRVFSENSEEDLDEDMPIGTFEAQVGAPSQEGFELLEGPATFEMSTTGGTSVFILRLASQLPNFDAPSRLDFAYVAPSIPSAGIYGIGHPTEDSDEYFVACFQSPNLDEASYKSESGELSVTVSADGQVEGTFDMTTYALVSTGPGASERIRLEITGSFNARDQSTGVLPGSVIECADT